MGTAPPETQIPMSQKPFCTTFTNLRKFFPSSRTKELTAAAPEAITLFASGCSAVWERT